MWTLACLLWSVVVRACSLQALSVQVAEGYFSAVSQAEETRILCQTTGLYHTLRCYQGCVVSLSPSALTLVPSSRGTVQERRIAQLRTLPA